MYAINFPNLTHFSITLPIDRRLTLTWNETGKFWGTKFYQHSTGEELLLGGALVAGTELFRTSPYWDMSAVYFAAGGRIRDPGRDDLHLGTLYVYDKDEDFS